MVPFSLFNRTTMGAKKWATGVALETITKVGQISALQ